MNLSNLKPAEGSVKSQGKRVGRGQGSGKGGTATRGHKGAKSRSGYSRKVGFEGGQMPLYMRLPKRGFNNINSKTYAVVNLGLIQKFVDAKKIDAKKPITEQSLVESGLVRRIKDGVRILAKGELTSKLDITVTGASASAIEAVAKSGGSLNVTKAAKVAE